MIAIVGSGRVAQAMGRLLAAGGEAVGWVASRNIDHAEAAARYIGGPARATPLDALARQASRVLVAVSDEAVTPVARHLAGRGFTSGIALHTCGAFGPEALAPLAAAGVSCGAQHPLQTVATPDQGGESLPGCTVGITADGPALDWALAIAAVLGATPLPIAAGGRALYHAAAVVASNFPAALLACATGLLGRAGVDPNAALAAVTPLAASAIRNIAALGLTDALTGPVARGDVDTIARHLAALGDAPRDAALYVAACRALLPLAAGRGTSPAALDRIERLLAAQEHRHD